MQVFLRGYEQQSNVCAFVPPLKGWPGPVKGRAGRQLTAPGKSDPNLFPDRPEAYARGLPVVERDPRVCSAIGTLRFWCAAI